MARERSERVKLRHKRKRDSKEQQPDASEQQSKRVKLGGKPQESESAIATIAKQSPPSIQESELNGPQTDVAVQEYQTTRVEREETQEGKTTKSEKKRKRRENEKAKTAENGTAVLGQDTVGSKQAVPVIALTCEGHKEGSSSKPHQNDDARVSTTNQDSGSVAEAKRGRRGRSKHSTAGGPTWNISRPVGGRFLSAEPIFTPDEKHLILATKRAVQIYSTSSSLLIRTITMTKSHAIAFYALSTLDSDNLYVATSSGSISLWNWVDGKKLTGWDTKSQIRGMATASTKEDAEDTIYTINKRDQRWSINAYRVRGELPDEAKVQHIALLQSSKPLRSFEVMDGGSHIVAAHTDSLSIGRITSMRNSELKDLRYAWLEVRCTDTVTCFDARVITPSADDISKGSLRVSNSSLDIAVGSIRGSLMVYEDLYNKLVQAEQSIKGNGSSPQLFPRILFWHREAVSTVRWSRDGNYVISGGKETVLVIWQQATEKKTFLPNLTSQIDLVVISPSGASYAVQLADNSVMVLSTTEMKPRANIAGIQARSLTFDDLEMPKLTTITSSAQASQQAFDVFSRTAATCNSLRPNQLILAVPASETRVERGSAQPPAPFLQTFDMSTSHHISRQAATRNNVTNFNVGPEGLKLQEPDIKMLQVTRDGKWLATIEEWIPPTKDVAFLAADDVAMHEAQCQRREVYLKFWRWDAKDQRWALNTRVDAPHQSSDGQVTYRALDLIADPSSVGFTTIGEDGIIRVWKPKTRFRNGVVVHGSNTEGSVDWSCRHSTELDNDSEILDAGTDLSTPRVPVRACLAYSTDGSVLAASQDFASVSERGVVHFIDTSTSKIRYSKSGLYNSSLISFDFTDRYFIILSDTLSVWDLVNDELSYGFTLRDRRLTPSQKVAMFHLAINRVDGTFAVALPTDDGGKQTSGVAFNPKRLGSKIMVFEPMKPEPLYVTSNASLTNVVTALLPAQGSKGYIAIDAAAEIRILSPSSTSVIPLIGPAVGADQPLAALDDDTGVAAISADNGLQRVDEGVTEADQVPALSVSRHQKRTREDVNDDKPVVRPEQLAEIFEGAPSFAMPPIRDLFDSVVRLYAGKRRRVVQSLPHRHKDDCIGSVHLCSTSV